MNGILDTVEMKMLEELMKNKVVLGKRYTDKKKYLKDLIRQLYLSL